MFLWICLAPHHATQRGGMVKFADSIEYLESLLPNPELPIPLLRPNLQALPSSDW